MQEIKSNKIFQNEVIIKKSRFICLITKVKTEKEALIFINTHKETTARHNCYAYIVGKNQEIIRKNDDGEPTNTAGKPILDILQYYNLTNIVCLIIRYFGGIKLGANGLIRAYAQATKENLKNIELITYINTRKIAFTFDFKNLKIVNDFLAINYKDIKIEKKFTDIITYEITIPEIELANIIIWTKNNKIKLFIFQDEHN